MAPKINTQEKPSFQLARRVDLEEEGRGFEDLPDELICKIFSSLNGIDLASAAQVCRRFSRILQEDAARGMIKAGCIAQHILNVNKRQLHFYPRDLNPLAPLIRAEVRQDRNPYPPSLGAPTEKGVVMREWGVEEVDIIDGDELIMLDVDAQIVETDWARFLDQKDITHKVALAHAQAGRTAEALALVSKGYYSPASPDVVINDCLRKAQVYLALNQKGKARRELNQAYLLVSSLNTIPTLIPLDTWAPLIEGYAQVDDPRRALECLGHLETYVASLGPVFNSVVYDDSLKLAHCYAVCGLYPKVAEIITQKTDKVVLQLQARGCSGQSDSAVSMLVSTIKLYMENGKEQEIVALLDHLEANAGRGIPLLGGITCRAAFVLPKLATAYLSAGSIDKARSCIEEADRLLPAPAHPNLNHGPYDDLGNADYDLALSATSIGLDDIAERATQRYTRVFISEEHDRNMELRIKLLMVRGNVRAALDLLGSNFPNSLDAIPLLVELEEEYRKDLWRFLR